MSLRLALLGLCLWLGAAQAETTRAVTGTTVDVSGDTPAVCLKLIRPPADNAADFVTVEPGKAVALTDKDLCVSGLAFGSTATVHLRPGFPFKDGVRQAADEAVTLAIPDRDPLIAIGGRGWVLPRPGQGATGLTIQTVNTPHVRIRVWRMAERALTAALPGTGPYSRLDRSKQSWESYELRTVAGDGATLIWSGRLDTAPGRNVAVETAFPLAGLIDPAKPGAYFVAAENGDRPVPSDDNTSDDTVAGRWVLSTDLGVSSWSAEDGLHVTVRALGSAEPLPGTRLRLLSAAQDTLAETVTDAAGQALIAPGLMRGLRGAAPAVLTAARGDDFAAQDLTGPALDLSAQQPGPSGRVLHGPAEAYVYTDRGIYRPGETVQVMALIRDHALAAVDAPLTLVLRRPDGLEARRYTLPPQPAAGFQQAVALSATAAQGSWTIEAYLDPTLPAIGRVTVAVQDFVPQQLKVALTSATGAVEPDGHLVAALDGRFLYGPPAAGLHAEGEIRLVRDENPVPDAPGYRFGLVDETVADPVQPLELADADAAGRVTIDTVVKVPDGVLSPLRAVLVAGLTEPGGRAVKQTLSLPIHARGTLIGIKPGFADRVEIGNPATFSIRAFGPVPTRLDWQLVREVRNWDWFRADRSWTYHFHVTDHEVAYGTLQQAADMPFSQVMDEWGSYRLIVSDPATHAISSVRFQAGWGAVTELSDVPDKLDVSADATIPADGQVRVHIQGPFAGQAQIMVAAAGRIIETRQIDLPATGATVTLAAGPDWGTGAHVLVTAYRPLAQPGRTHDPVRAVGLAWTAADPAPHTLAVSIGGTRLVTPRQTVTVPLHVSGAHGAAFVTLAAVDEGILQLTKFTSPDPLGALLARPRLGIDMRDEYGRLLTGEAETGVIHEGGDGGDSLGGAGLAVTTHRTVALFHGPVPLDGNGDAAVTLDIPDFAGELRLMAVAYDAAAAGHADAALTVRDPVVADVTLPRFLAPDDVAELTSSLHNTDGPAGDYRMTLTATGAVKIERGPVLAVHLAATQRQEAPVTLRATGIGTGHIVASITGPGLALERSWDIAVRTPHPDLVLSQTDSQAPGTAFTLDPALLQPFVPGSVQVTIGYSQLAGIDVPALLQSLYAYPYGCTEQLSSTASPLLYVTDDTKLLGHRLKPGAVHRRVQDAIGTIEDRQDASGRFGLWRVNDRQGSVWLNVYALDFLLRAREAGYDVPARVTAAASTWIEQQLQSGLTEDRGGYAEAPGPTRAYAAWVMARSSRVDPSRLRALRSGLDVLGGGSLVSWRGGDNAAALSLAHLAGATSLMGDASGSTTLFKAALAAVDRRDPPRSWYDFYYWSAYRDLAGVADIAAETGHDDILAPLLDRIRRDRVDPERMNTQEKAALLATAHALNKRGSTRMLALGAAPATAVTLPYALSPSSEDISRGVKITLTDTQPVFRTLTLRGAPIKAPPALADGYRLGRKVLTLNGEPLAAGTLHQADRFIVVLTGSSDTPGLRRTILVDPMPAGWEIESLVKPDAYPFLGQLTALRAHEERDDRFVAALDLGEEDFHEVDDTKPGPLTAQEFRVAYVARAVTPGQFVRPEAVVQDMYRPDVMARTGSGRTVVVPR